MSGHGGLIMPGAGERNRAGGMHSLIAQLCAIVGERGLLTGHDAAMRPCDPFQNVAPALAAIVRPGSTAELSSIMALCTRRKQPVVIQGGRTGVVGGACARDGDVVISLERMNAIERIDPIGQIAVVQAGATLEAVQNAVGAQDMLYPVDLGSKGSATIGGTIATNAGGNRALRWGMTRANILGLEAVLADGTVVNAMNRMIKNNTGYDVKQMLIGSEGTIGIVTRAVLRLVPAPRSQRAAFAAVPDFMSLLELLRRARQMQVLSAFEVMWGDYYDLVALGDASRCPVPCGHPYYVLIEAMGYDEAADIASFDALLDRAFDAGLIADAVMASSGRQVSDLWRVREGSEIIVREMSPFISFDISVDIGQAEAFVDAAKSAVLDLFDFSRFVTFGHLGDNNLHLGVHVGPDTRLHARKIEDIVYGVVADYDAALTAEHGIGQFKREYLPRHVSAGALACMKRIRSAMDPDGLLNPEVLFRTSCAKSVPTF